MSFPRYESYKDSGVEWLGKVPGHWEIASLSRLFRIKAGGDVKTEFFSEVQTEDHPYPIYTNANDEKAIYGFTSKCNFPPNTITVSGRGEVGFAAFRDHPYDAIIRLLVLPSRHSHNAGPLYKPWPTSKTRSRSTLSNKPTSPTDRSKSIMACLPPILARKKFKISQTNY